MNGNQALSFSEAGLECEAFFSPFQTPLSSVKYSFCRAYCTLRADVRGVQVRPLSGV